MENNYRLEVTITFMLIAYLVVLCEFFWEFSIFQFCRPLVDIYWHPLLKFRLQTWQNGSFGNSFLLCFFSSNVDKIIQNCWKYLFWGKRTPTCNQVRYYNVLGICCSQEPTNRFCWLTLWYKPHKNPRPRVY